MSNELEKRLRERPKYRECPACEASFKLLSDQPFPPHSFCGKPCDAVVSTTPKDLP